MSIYFVRSDNLIKIGFSQQVAHRTKTVIAGRGMGEYLGHMPGDRELEKFLHGKSARYSAPRARILKSSA